MLRAIRMSLESGRTRLLYQGARFATIAINTVVVILRSLHWGPVLAIAHSAQRGVCRYIAQYVTMKLVETKLFLAAKLN